MKRATDGDRHSRCRLPSSFIVAGNLSAVPYLSTAKFAAPNGNLSLYRRLWIRTALIPAPLLQNCYPVEAADEYG